MGLEYDNHFGLEDMYRNNDSDDENGDENGDVIWICKHNRRADRCRRCSPQYTLGYSWKNKGQNQTVKHKNELQETLQNPWWLTSSTKPLFSHPQTRFFWFLIEKWFIHKDWENTLLIFMTLETLNDKLKTCEMKELKKNKRWKTPEKKTFCFTNSRWVEEQWKCTILRKTENGETRYALKPTFPQKEYKKRKNSLRTNH